MAGSRRRQARLAFTPLPSSSPAAKGYHQQIQDRAAAVSVDSPAKRRKLQHNGEGHKAGETMPTPAASREKPVTKPASDEDDSEPVRATQRLSTQRSKKTRRARQQRIDFSNARDPDSFSSPIKLRSSSPSNKPSSSGPGMFSSQRRSVVVDSSSGSEEDLPSAQELLRPSRKSAKSKPNGNVRKTRSSSIVVPSEGEEDKADEIVVQPQGRNPIEYETDDDDEMPTTLGTQRRGQRQRAPKDDFVVSSPPQMEDSEIEVEVVENPKKRRRRDESEDEELITPRSKRKMSQREKDELAEDLDFLQPSSEDEAGVRAPGGTQSAQKSKRSHALARLKQSRSSKFNQIQQIDEESDGEDDLPVSSVGLFNENEDEQDFIEEGEEDDELLGIPEDMPIEFTHWQRKRPKELFKFAVEWMVQNKINPAFGRSDQIYRLTFGKLDDETQGLVGSKFVSSAWTADFANALKARPELAKDEFDRNAAENFGRDKCDACNRTNHPPAYEVQFQGKPYLLSTLQDLGSNDDDEDDNNDSDSDSQNSTSQPTYDANGNEISPETRIFYVGRFCMANAQTAHALQHWRYHLNAYIVTWLTRAGYDSPEAIVKREKMSAKKRRKHANKIVDTMEEEGLIKSLWNDFRQNLDEARNAKQGRF